MSEASRPTTVLAVDDNPDILMAVENHLLLLDYEVQVANNAAEALDVIRQGKVPDVLFTDIVMPGIVDGVELGKMVSKSHPRVGILLMTGWPGENVNHSFPVLTKPFELVELTDWIEQFLQTRNGS